MYRYLTNRQREILEFIESYMSLNGYPPTYREIADFFGIRTPRGVQQHLKALEKKGIIKLSKGKARSIKIVRNQHEYGLPLIGISSAGFPIESEPLYNKKIIIDPRLTGTDKGFIVKVSGESLSGIGIHDGDMVVISQDATPVDGDIVLARVNGEITLKILKKLTHGVRLKSANPDYPDIEIKKGDDFEIIGKATLVLRKL